MESCAPSCLYTSHEPGSSRDWAAPTIETARGTAALQQSVELGGGCLVRAAVALSLGAGDPAAESLLERLTR